MIFKLFLAFTLIPAMEIFLFIEIGKTIGTFNTFLLVIISGILGAYLAKMQGLQAISRIQHQLEQGIMPAEEMVDAFIILIAGIVLLTPGFITDIAGLLLLFPPTRFYFKRFARYKFDQWIQRGDVHFRIHF